MVAYQIQPPQRLNTVSSQYNRPNIGFPKRVGRVPIPVAPTESVKGTMRKLLEAISLLALGIQISFTIRALFGSDRLPERVPTHFDAAGNPNGWSSPTMLLMLPAVAVTIYLLFTVVSQFPSAFNYPVQVTVTNRLRLQTLALDMIEWIKAEVVVLFAWMQWATIQLARHPQHGLPALMMPVALVAVFATVASYIVAMFKIAKEPAGL